jgi:hypothetical protein
MGGGSAKTAGDSSTDQPIFNTLTSLGTGGSSVGTGQAQQAQGVSALQPSLNYYSALLSGDPTATAAAIAPTTSGIMSQYDTAYKNLTDNAPQGGQRSGNIANLQGQEAGSVGSVIQNVQPQAAQALGGLGLGLAGAGTAEQGTGQSALAQSLASLLGMRGQDIGYSENQQQQNNALGSILGALLGGSSTGGGATGTQKTGLGLLGF